MGHHRHSALVGDVLIPILMDYPLGGIKHEKQGPVWTGLNPYSNGLPSRGIEIYQGKIRKHCSLNPYSNGLPSRGGFFSSTNSAKMKVLIPILMDYPLGVLVTSLLVSG